MGAGTPAFHPDRRQASPATLPSVAFIGPLPAKPRRPKRLQHLWIEPQRGRDLDEGRLCPAELHLRKFLRLLQTGEINPVEECTRGANIRNKGTWRAQLLWNDFAQWTY